MSNSTFTRAELFELLSASYSPQQIIILLIFLPLKTVGRRSRSFCVGVARRRHRLQQKHMKN